jgi:molybdopterin synthase catalytic subunit
VISVIARYFASVREVAGLEEEAVSLASGARVADLVAEVLGRRPELESWAGHVRFAVNREFVGIDALLSDGDEISWLPPVSGGSQVGETFGIQEVPIAPDQAVHRLGDSPEDRGALATFAGIVRRHSRGRRVDHLEYEAHREMALKVFASVSQEAKERWDLLDVAIVHRIGRLEVGEVAISVAVSAAHRAPALEACRHVIDRLKQDAPIWKKEVGEEGDAWWSEGS